MLSFFFSVATRCGCSQGDMDNIFPKFRFFPANGAADVEYTGPVTADAMILYLKKESKRQKDGVMWQKIGG